jgi:hypothetical protein
MRMSKLVLLAVLAVTWNAARADDKSDGLLEQARKRQEVEAQRLEAEVNAALKEAEKNKGNPAKAAETLRGVLPKIENDTALKSEKRVSLLLSVKEKIATLEVTAKSAKESTTADVPAPKKDDAKIDENLRRDLETLKALQLEGRILEASRVAEGIAKKYPDHPAALQARERTRVADSVREAGNIRAEKAGSTTASNNSSDRSAIPPTGDYELPKDWAKKSADRLAKYGNSLVKMSDREKMIVEILNGTTTTPIDFKDMSFEEVIKLIEKELRLPLVVNKQALDEMKVGYETTLSVSLPKQVSRRTLLRRCLGELGLTYIVKNENIEVTSVLRAQSELTTRVFDISDLVRMGNLAGWTGGQGKDPVQALIDFIQATIDPGSWQKNGGAGSITYFAPKNILIIRNTAEVINSMGGGRAK